MTPSLAQLRAFEAAGRLLGIRKAAAALQLDHGVISRHLRSIEDWAGVRLFHRVGPRLEMTHTGRRFHASITRALAEIDRSSKELLEARATRKLRIWCVPGLASQWLAGRLSSFQHAHSDLELELHPTDGSPDFERDEADIDIRFVESVTSLRRAGTSRGVRHIEIARPPVIPVAAPAVLADGKVRIERAADLLKFPLLHEDGERQWRDWLAAQNVAVPGRFHGPKLWHAHLTIEAARAGQGIALANAFLVEDDLASGRLVVALPPAGMTQVLGAYILSARADSWGSPPISRFRRWVIQAARRRTHPHEPRRDPQGTSQQTSFISR